MQAALDKRAALMLRVHEARMAGDLVEAKAETVQKSNMLVAAMQKLVEDNNILSNRTANTFGNTVKAPVCSLDVLKTTDPVKAAWLAMVKPEYKNLSHPVKVYSSYETQRIIEEVHKADLEAFLHQTDSGTFYKLNLKPTCLPSLPVTRLEEDDESPFPLPSKYSNFYKLIR